MKLVKTKLEDICKILSNHIKFLYNEGHKQNKDKY